MNRPSRTEDDLEHPTWNQNPPFLAPDLTTRQDLNGLANAREHRHGDAGTANGLGLVIDEKHACDGQVCHREREGFIGGLFAVGRRSNRLPIAPRTALGGEGQVCLSRGRVRPPSGWLGWLASVVVGSIVVHGAGSLLFPLLGTMRPVNGSANGTEPVEVRRVDADPAPTLVSPRNLTPRQPTCAGSTAGAEYNTPLHVGALLIILTVSSAASAVPMLAAKFPVLRIPEPFFFAVRHFGTGVLLATAFVHLLPTAFISLGNPCLSSFWTTDYPAMPGAIALVGIFFVSVIEMIFSPARTFMAPPTKGTAGGDRSNNDGSAGDAESQIRHKRHASMSGGHCSNAAVVAAITRRPSETARQTSRASIEPARRHGQEADSEAVDMQVTASKETLGQVEAQLGGGLTEEQLHKKSILQCMLLEVGILFHSVFIGMALSVAVGGNFVVLLIAIAFHQTFEGLALGARIASIKWPKKTLQPWLMVLAYGCTTPMGQAIGLATHSLYSPDSEFGLILVGTMNAVSSGLLVFAALIELLAEDFLSDQSWAVLRGRKRVVACGLVLLGAVCMSLVGAWA
ncbi:ZIP zinc transporter-domain-containing protein [Dichotomopilus funicola]|uniref:ZIP zinc transporter-domain-containing protein n=1 Tax=Dichotomopilus funicola TaxID=1934379 RepID=A0AAN6UY88_9PEZI|nr:ZIP zinc transporter-domain-containing protein [Dichotomopilus funicola]